MLISTALLGFLYFRPKPPAVELTRFQIPVPEDKASKGGNINLSGMSVSPDGSRLVFLSGTGANARPFVFVCLCRPNSDD